MLYSSKSLVFSVLGLLFLGGSCSSNTGNNTQTAQNRLTVRYSKNTIVYAQNDTVGLKIEINESGFVPDSVLVLVDSIPQGGVKKWQAEMQFVLTNQKFGYHSLMYKYFFEGQFSTNTLSLTIVPAEAPVECSYEVKAVYNHDTMAYTQGLIIDNGTTYEGTGLYGESTLRRVDLKTGKVLQQISIDRQFFGEGITVVGNRLYQITWQSNFGFVYDKKTFNRVKEFTYSTEGWGLTFDGSHLIMSDGSEYLYFLDTTSLQRVHKLAVFDNKTAITRLNELEYVDGYIYANIYTTNLIVKIDPKTGAVVERINFDGLMSMSDRTATMDVLNGIAWDESHKKMYVTGKKWSKLYEVEIKKKN